jgi:chitinase
MSNSEINAKVALLGLLFVGGLTVPIAQADAANNPPAVSIAWPRSGDAFSVSTLIKIKANVTDPDGSVAQVQFLVETNLIGVVSNPPFNLLWSVGEGLPVGLPCRWMLKAVAVDHFGARTESAPVKISCFAGGPPEPVVEMLSPRNGALLPDPASFALSAEVLASAGGDAGPVEFFVGANSVGLVDESAILTATTPPSSVTVSNLPEGEYKLTVRYRGDFGQLCLTCLFTTNTIHVVKLGVQSPGLTPDGQLRFEVVTSFPGRPTVIEASPNLHDWLPINTNQPVSNTFTFTESSPATNSHRFYRVFVPPE